MLSQPEFKLPHEGFHRLGLRQRVIPEIIPEVVGFHTHEESAGTQDAQHFAQGVEGLGEMHEHGLAGDGVEAGVGQGQLGGVAWLERNQFRRDVGEGAAKSFGGFGDPARFAVNAGEARGGTQIRV